MSKAALKELDAKDVLLVFPEKSKEDIPVTGMAVLRQQYTLAEAIEEWICLLYTSVCKSFSVCLFSVKQKRKYL